MVRLEQPDPDMAPLTFAMLAAVSPQQLQKKMLGGRLLPLVHNILKMSANLETWNPADRAAEVTNILLEKKKKKLLRMLEDENFLKSKVGIFFHHFDLFYVNTRLKRPCRAVQP